jgi:hypothetical protein
MLAFFTMLLGVACGYSLARRERLSAQWHYYAAKALHKDLDNLYSQFLEDMNDAQTKKA